MDKKMYNKIEQYMIECMKDSAHDKEHIYRVLYLALDIAKSVEGVRMDILTTSCILHDIGREQQYIDKSLCHATVGGEMAFKFLIANGFSYQDAKHIQDCISTHSYRNNSKQPSIEAQILFDADKLGITGAIGIARTLLYQGKIGEPLYYIDETGHLIENTEDAPESFIKEYNYKLKKIYINFFTPRATQIAKERKQAAAVFYEAIKQEAEFGYQKGKKILNANIV